MGTKTNIPYGSPIARTLQSVGLFAANMARNTTLNRLTGAMPTQAQTEGTLRKQSSSHYPIVRAQDLGKTTGDEITFDLLNPTGGLPIMGGEYAEGRGIGMSFAQDRLRVNQARFPISAGDTMSQIRTSHELRGLGRATAQAFMDRYCDQSTLVHMAGARGFHNNIEWAVPLAANEKFASVMVNPVRAPSRNRHYISTGSGVEPFKTNAGEVDIQTTDVFNKDVVDSIRTVMETIALPPPAVIFEGDKAATDSPLRVLLVSPAQYSGFATDPSFRSFQASAMARAQQANMHPLFLGEAGLWNGTLIVKMPKPIRFYAGDTVEVLRQLHQRSRVVRGGAGRIRHNVWGGSGDSAGRPGAGRSFRQAWGLRRAVLLVGKGAGPRRQAGNAGRLHPWRLEDPLQDRSR